MSREEVQLILQREVHDAQMLFLQMSLSLIITEACYACPSTLN